MYKVVYLIFYASDKPLGRKEARPHQQLPERRVRGRDQAPQEQPADQAEEGPAGGLGDGVYSSF